MSQFAQTPQFNQYQNIQNQNQRQYNEDLIKLAGFSFPFNNLLLVSLIKRVPKDTQDQKETHLGFVTCVLGVGANNNRTYDFQQKIVQKFSLKDLQSLAFTLKQLALSDTQVLPFTKFTNSGSGSKTLYIQYKENLDNFNNVNNNNAQQQFQTQQGQGFRRVQSNIIIGSSYGNLKINIPLSKSDAYSIGDVIQKLYEKGIQLEIKDQIERNINSKDYSANGNQHFPAAGNNMVQFPTSSPVNVGQFESGNNIVNSGPQMGIQPSAPQMVEYGNKFVQMVSSN